MRPAKIVFREAPRFLELRSQQLRAATWPVMRATLVYGLPLSAVGLYILYRITGDVVPPIEQLLGLPAAVLGIGLGFYFPVWLIRVPGLSQHFLNSWRAMRHGLFWMRGGYGGIGIAWKSIDSLEVDNADDEVTLKVTARRPDGSTFTGSLTCLRSEVPLDAIARLRASIANKTLI